MSVRVIHGVPQSQVPAVEQMLRDSGAVTVTHSSEGPGVFLVTGFFLDMEQHADLMARIAASG